MAELQDALVALVTAVVEHEEHISDGKWFTEALVRYEDAVRAEEQEQAEEHLETTRREWEMGEDA